MSLEAKHGFAPFSDLHTTFGMLSQFLSTHHTLPSHWIGALPNHSQLEGGYLASNIYQQDLQNKCKPCVTCWTHALGLCNQMALKLHALVMTLHINAESRIQ